MERWWVLDGGYRWSPARNGRLFSGPYSTRDDAFTARQTIEILLNRDDLFVEQQQTPETHDSGSGS